MQLVDKPLHELLAAFASPDPTPGGGSAAATAAAIGAALLTMVAGLPRTRAGTDDDRAALDAASASLRRLQQQLTRAIDEDTTAYDAVVAAYKQPKASDAEQAARKASIQRALRGATDVPLGVMRASAAALTEAVAVAVHGHRAATSDVGVAVALLRAGVHGARLNVETNLNGVSDSAYKDASTAEVTQLSENAGKAADAAAAALS